VLRSRGVGAGRTAHVFANIARRATVYQVRERPVRVTDSDNPFRAYQLLGSRFQNIRMLSDAHRYHRPSQTTASFYVRSWSWLLRTIPIDPSSGPMFQYR
jgi:hypothetical protein